MKNLDYNLTADQLKKIEMEANGIRTIDLQKFLQLMKKCSKDDLVITIRCPYRDIKELCNLEEVK